jgi:hypothetical protein
LGVEIQKLDKETSNKNASHNRVGRLMLLEDGSGAETNCNYDQQRRRLTQLADFTHQNG